MATSNDGSRSPSPSTSEATTESMDLEYSCPSSPSSNPSESNQPFESSLKKKFSEDELKEVFLPIFQKLGNSPEFEPFKFSIDPETIYDRKHLDMRTGPMTFYTIRVKMEHSVYDEPWAVIEDIWKIFDHGLTHSKDSYVHTCSDKISKLFDTEVDVMMRKLGYCCGLNRTYNPRTLTCHGADLCSIAPWAMYHSYENGEFCLCQKCFKNTRGSTLTVTSTAAVPLDIPKKEFKVVKNSELLPEPFVVCRECERKFHAICVLYHEGLATNGFRCAKCLALSGSPAILNPYTAQKLPSTNMTAHIEQKVNAFLNRQRLESGLEVGSIFVRVLSSCDKVVKIKPNMKQRFQESGNPVKSFPYRSKAIFAFVNMEGADVMFFAIYVQEYGSDCPWPNKRRVFLSYLDSLKFLEPTVLRTGVYQEIILGYLEYAKLRGFTVAHVWSCPPKKGDDYIFNAHPPEMKTPNMKRLQDWYKRIFDRGVEEGIVASYQDMLTYVLSSEQIKSPLDIPYFEGDHWPSALESAADETVKGHRSNATTRSQKCLPESKASCQSPPETKKKMDKKIHLTSALISELKRLKDSFFVVRLNNASYEIMFETSDPDPLNDHSKAKHNTVRVDDRVTFLISACDRYREFSSLRRAKFSTMLMLYDLHTIEQRGIDICSICLLPLRIRFTCLVCKDFDVCPYCQEIEQNAHLRPLPAPFSGSNPSSDERTGRCAILRILADLDKNPKIH